jgi:hypothetical protein
MASGHLRAPHKQAEQMAAPTSAAEPSKNPLPTGSRPQMSFSQKFQNPFSASASFFETDTIESNPEMSKTS